MNIDKISSNLSFENSKRWKNGLENIDKMMERRGFHFERQLELLFFLYEKENDSCIVCIFPNDKLSIETLREIIQFCESQKCRNIVLILQNYWSTNCKKILENLTFFSIDIFYLKEFQYDLTELYYYVPHEKIDDPNLIQEIKTSFGNSMPVLLKTDVISRYFKFERGDIIRVRRNDFNTETICYRIVK